MKASDKKQVVFMIPRGVVNLISLIAVSEVLHWASEQWQAYGKRTPVEIKIITLDPKLQSFNAGFTEFQLLAYNEVDPDLIIIPSLSGRYKEVVKCNPEFIEWLTLQHERGTKIAAICTGAFLLAATGLLNGKACSTHWDAVSDFKQMFPKVNVGVDVLTVTNDLYTNGGGYSFLNLALFLVEQYFDRETAIHCSKMFQIDFGRTSQTQFSMFQTQKQHNDKLVLVAQEYIEKNLSDRISFEELSKKLAVSRRNFDRRFLKATGNSPLEYMQRLRIESARSALESSDRSVLEIMIECGYSDEKSFRELFRKIVGVSPLDYKAKFARSKTVA